MHWEPVPVGLWSLCQTAGEGSFHEDKWNSGIEIQRMETAEEGGAAGAEWRKIQAGRAGRAEKQQAETTTSVPLAPFVGYDTARGGPGKPGKPFLFPQSKEGICWKHRNYRKRV